MAIIKHYLPETLSEIDFKVLVPLTSGFSGADLAQVCRQVRRAARQEKRTVVVDDLVCNLPRMFPVDGPYRKAAAVHEAGHTLVGTRLNYGKFLGVAIADFIRPAQGQPAGGAAFDLPQVAVRNKQTYLDQACTLLAGLAAEQVALGSFGDGGGSDIEATTTLATLMEAKFGFGETIRHTLARDAEDWEQARRSDPALRKNIEGILAEQFQRAKEILTKERGLLDALAEFLVQHGSATPEQVDEMVTRFDENRIEEQAA